MTNDAPRAEQAVVRAFQIGLEWFPERGGGLDRYFHDLVTLGHGAAMDMAGIVTGDGGAERETGGRIVSFASPTAPLPQRLILARRSTARGIAAHRPDLIASHFALHAFPALDLIAKADRPFVVHFHGPWAAEASTQRSGRRIANSLQHGIERRIYRRADRVIVLSEAFAQLVHADYGVPADRIAVVPGSIRVDRFDMPDRSRQDARAMLGWPIDRRILLSVRRLVRRMGLERLIDALEPIVRRHPDLLLLIAGKGPEQVALEARIAARGLAAHVRLLGFVPDAALPLAYRAADCSIVPTIGLEGFGLIAAESLAAGTPVIVTPVGGLPEVVRPLAPSLVVTDTSVDAIRAGVTAWADGSLVVPEAAACRDYARRMFSWEAGTKRLAETYRAVLA
jgi:glycogen(starch) synthase